VSIIIITEEISREAYTRTSVYFLYSEERRREAHTAGPVLFLIQKKEGEKHTPGPGKYYYYNN
jgi:hypothetical protein